MTTEAKLTAGILVGALLLLVVLKKGIDVSAAGHVG